MSENFDVVVIGAGPGGYIAAIRAAQLGKKVACIEKWLDCENQPKLGGTCLNVGCIPSKALLASSEEFEKTQHHLACHGITVEKVSIDIKKMQARKDNIVKKMTRGIEYLFKKNKITWFQGQAQFTKKLSDAYEIAVLPSNEKNTAKEASQTQAITAHSVIIATGSKARHLPNIPIDNQFIVDNEGALTFDTVPNKLAVIGAGVIGVELGSVWRRLGADVTILEAYPSFLPTVDAELAKEAEKEFKNQGLKFELGIKINQVEKLNASKKADQSIRIQYSDAQGNSKELLADRLIVAVGRVPNTDNLGLENIGIKTDEKGFIKVDKRSCLTELPNVYAIGDVIGGPMLAHKAEDEGVLAAEIICGQKPQIDYNCIPWVIYTSPEVAWVGKTEANLKDEGREYKSGKFPFAANGRALGIEAPKGFVKILADKKTDEILGVHIISVNASDLIAEAVVAMEFKAASEDIAMISHPHPSLSEVMREAALAVDKRALNM